MAGTIAVIPARGGSKGIPRKNMISFAGKPLLYWSVRQALDSKLLDRVFVSSDDEEILSAARSWGAEAIHRPVEISGDTASSESALLHALETMNPQPDTMVFLQATSPLRLPGDIDGAIVTFRAKGTETVFSAADLEDFICWQEDDKGLNCLMEDPRHRKRRQDRTGRTVVENGSIYVIDTAALRRTGSRFGDSLALHPMKIWQSFEIDTLEQLPFIEMLFHFYIKPDSAPR
jgi:CMP-N,N'-diacetyllegionaminic acid synthase